MSAHRLLIVCSLTALTVGWFAFILGAKIAKENADLKHAQITCHEVALKVFYDDCVNSILSQLRE